ncbi:MAG: hypothetical protein DHS20C11_01130 [Lysobacteraceae bacterium]|nr:MAG: hypothetical protein DHS20C11_01130 [Xanthomonadaceae bacterium]
MTSTSMAVSRDALVRWAVGSVVYIAANANAADATIAPQITNVLIQFKKSNPAE